MKMTNQEIYTYAQELNKEMGEMQEYIPVKANFLIQKNWKLIREAAQEIEKTRLEIAEHYGKPDEEGTQYNIPPENYDAAAKELTDLFAIEQELEIRTFSLDTLGDTKFTSGQMQAIMFMIDEE